VHTAANPGGEIRGQILVRPFQFGARLDGSQSGTPSAATGNADLTLNPDNTLTYNVTVSGMSGNAAHVHGGSFGVPGGIEVPLLGGPTTWSGTSLPLSSEQIDKLQDEALYINVHSGAFPGGEIRGQVIASSIPYGPSSNPPTGVITLNATGAPTDLGGGGTFTLSISNGRPFGLGYMFASLGPDAVLFKQEPFLVDLGTTISTTLLPLDGTGSLSVPVVTPPLPFSFELFMQFFGLDGTAPNGQFNVSNGLQIPFRTFP
jgi:hypothetical protein